jgi:choline transport protein
MMWTAVLNGTLGWVMLVTFCFCVGDPIVALDTPTGYPFIDMFIRSTGSHAGASIMTCILIVITIGGCVNNVASASRQLWSFARDEGLPFSGWLAHVWYFVAVCEKNLLN